MLIVLAAMTPGLAVDSNDLFVIFAGHLALPASLASIHRRVDVLVISLIIAVEAHCLHCSVSSQSSDAFETA
jgi:hypothetical protein